MSGPKDDKFDEAVTTPIESGAQTTPRGTAPQSAPSGAVPPDEQETTPFLTPPSKTPSREKAALADTATTQALAARYDLLAELGRGGMGVVYRARDRETGDTVALKVLLPQIAADQEVVERFKSELLLARKITHKNVCRVHDLARFGDVAAISMEYVEGDSLRAILRRFGGVPLRRGIEWVRQISSALAEAHGQGVVHRDLKPENVVITRDGAVKVMDFGIARSVEGSQTVAGTVMGTPAYMSPEQAAGKPADVRSDIYSLGLVMYEMFTGQATFKADSGHALLLKQMKEVPRAPRDVEPYLPAFLDRAIQKCLEKDPKKRFQTAAEVEAGVSGQALEEAAPEGEPEPSPHLTVWRRADWALLALGALSLVYFLLARDRVFPASKMRLEVEAISARRAAEELGQRLGRPFPESSAVRLESRAEQYRSAIENWAYPPGKGQKRPELEAYWPKELAVWRVEFSSAADHLFLLQGAVPDRYAIVNVQGKVLEFVNQHVSGGIPAKYQPKSAEERRAIARQAAEHVCGPLAAEASLTETSGGERGSAYTAVWRRQSPRGSNEPTKVVRVSLVADQVVEARCITEGYTNPFPMPEKLLKGFQGLVWIMRLILGGIVLFYFVKGRCYTSPLLLKRIPLAIVLGYMGGWILLPGTDSGGVPTGAGIPEWALYGLVAFSSAGFTLLAVVTVEHYMRRRAPELIATYLLAMRGLLRETAVGLAVVRGVLLGLLLAGLETLMTHATVWVGANRGANKFSDALSMFLLPFVDPLPVGQALESFSPGLYVVCATLTYGSAIGLLILGTGWFAAPKKSKPEPPVRTLKLKDRDAAGMMALVATPGGLGAMLPRPINFYMNGMGEGLLVGWLARRFDLLTMVVAVGTAVLWIMNYPLLVIMREVGNAAHWAIFIGWGLFALAAVWVAFRAPLLRALRQATAE